ncbi:hypothetical protein ABZ468_36735 [Streptomyces sp. NPDC005708]|uniref:hypothetical protein n=1 Tax=Streptomyces sp. NPDC005708 TaxID=3154564 RepID=UPI00340BBF00
MITTTEVEDHRGRGVIPSETLEVYAPYQRETKVVGRAALPAVDLFVSAFPSGPSSLADAVRVNRRSRGTYAWRAMPVLHDLFDTVRDTGSGVAGPPVGGAASLTRCLCSTSLIGISRMKANRLDAAR